MTILSAQKINALYWLGRYETRVMKTLLYLWTYYDGLIDGKPFSFQAFCDKLGIQNRAATAEEFFRLYFFDKRDPVSLRSAADAMLQNGVVLRSDLGTETFGYLQLACNAFDRAEVAANPRPALQDVLDNLFAFEGKCLSTLPDLCMESILRCGEIIEALSLELSLSEADPAYGKELKLLVTILPWTGLPYDAAAFQTMVDTAAKETISTEDFRTIKNAAETLLSV